MKKRIIALYVAGALILAGVTACNSSTTTDNTSTAKTFTVTIENMQFNPASLVIHKGDTVVWMNKGMVGHNVTDDPSTSWTSGDIEVGKTWKMAPDESIKYFCTIHPTMKGTVTVQ